MLEWFQEVKIPQSKAEISLSDIVVNTIAADHLPMHGARASTAIVLTYLIFSGIFQSQHPMC